MLHTRDCSWIFGLMVASAVLSFVSVSWLTSSSGSFQSFASSSHPDGDVPQALTQLRRRVNGTRKTSSKASANGPNVPHRPRTICMIDTSMSHVDLLMNNYFSMKALHVCTEFKFLCYDKKSAVYLKRMGYQVLFNSTLLKEAEDFLLANPSCPTYLFRTMYVRSSVVTDLAETGARVIQADADVAFFRDPFEHIPHGGIMVSASLAPHGSHPEPYFAGHFSTGDWSTLNNGIIAFTGGNHTRRLFQMWYRDGVQQNYCSEGFGQTEFQKLVRKKLNLTLYQDPENPDEFFDFLDAEKKFQFRAFINLVSLDWMNPQRPYLIHAVGVSNDVPNRIKWLKQNKAWGLLDEWKDVMRFHGVPVDLEDESVDFESVKAVLSDAKRAEIENVISRNFTLSVDT
jgi:hypothetical protein